MTDHEINRRMAEVMGWHAYPGMDEPPENPVFPHVKVWSHSMSVSLDNWFCSYEWNPADAIWQAFEVAEKVGLFDDEDVHLCKMDGCWVTAQLDWKWDVYICYSEPFHTPALAICNAVIKAAKGKDNE